MKIGEQIKDKIFPLFLSKHSTYTKRMFLLSKNWIVPQIFHKEFKHHSTLNVEIKKMNFSLYRYKIYNMKIREVLLRLMHLSSKSKNSDSACSISLLFVCTLVFKVCLCYTCYQMHVQTFWYFFAPFQGNFYSVYSSIGPSILYHPHLPSLEKNTPVSMFQKSTENEKVFYFFKSTFVFKLKVNCWCKNLF